MSVRGPTFRMPFSRRGEKRNLARVCAAWLCAFAVVAAVERPRSSQMQQIDRKAVVRRHVVQLTGLGHDAKATAAGLDYTALTLTVGNGVIGFNTDATGMQSLNETWTTFPLATLSDWGWHSAPPPDPSPFDSFEYDYFNISTNRSVPYPMNTTESGSEWLRDNPHRLDLIQVALRRRSATMIPLQPADVNSGAGAAQELDPWTGEVSSEFTMGAGMHAVRTWTSCSMDLDLLAWRIETDLLGATVSNKYTHSTSDAEARQGSDNPATDADDRLVVRIAFPYGSPQKEASDWHQPNAHTTTLVSKTAMTARFLRTLDHDEYEVACRWTAGFALEADPNTKHAFVLASDSASGPAAAALELSCILAPPNARYPIAADTPWLLAKANNTRALLASGGAELPLYTAVSAEAASGWADFWESGAFVDLAGNSGANDPRAVELERRVVLSQYLTRSQSAGSTPPQETGYTLNSWGGKHHHEMRWWHQAHFALWMRPELLQRSDTWFVEMMPNATAYASFQGYAGARWPKMVGPATTARELARGVDWRGRCFDNASVGLNTTYSNNAYPLLYWTGPSNTGPMLIWQQPHIIWMTELQRLNAPTAAAATAVVTRMEKVVEATADFMASYAAPPPIGRGGGPNELWLGPPTDGAEEGNDKPETWNPTFELTYWRVGLKIASEWRQRAGLPSKSEWERVLTKLAAPTVLPGYTPGSKAYAINANCLGFPVNATVPHSRWGKHLCSGAYKSHPMVIGSHGMINGASINPPIDIEIMNLTLQYSIDGWNMASTWGWDFPIWALAQARLGWSPDAVVDMLLRNETKNFYLANGHGWQSPGSLPCYLPSNGGLLAAVAMMAGGVLDGGGVAHPVGFPPSWQARTEGFRPYP